ncbi:alpha/beta fold hydrolase [Streptomyces himalayensis]|uniref:Alpha/beta fold hydrolase n=1 Tax=Streptomyces himalayensis subsp. himalayensis TaxID=2756131 RepID=A0A7W0I9S5_9ACTN|nr:alpha/beta fold hydrolase [Streptomyces himalayensis]MBA2947568.1 alpha/beta fold hydrolase [Streptomyces himalayensis subsp. himalayensis]
MALLSTFIAVADRPGRTARAAAAYVRRHLVPGPPRPGGAVPHEAGTVVVPPRAASFVECRAAGLGPVTVAYERQGTGEPLVLLHGLGYHRQAWGAVGPLLAGSRDTIAMDLPGFGESPDLDPAVPRDLETAVAWLGAVFEELGVDRPHVVGHSLGGLIALRLGQAGLARSVTALAPAGFWTGAERRYAYAMLTAARQGVRLLPDEAMAWLARSPAGRAALTGTLYGRSLCPQETVVASLRALRDAAAFGSTLRAGREGVLFSGDIPDVPVTIAWGTWDRVLPPWQAYRVKAMIPDARLVPLPDCGHVPMNDAPELVARVILEATGLPEDAH